jgi:hypothetical protein
MNRERRRGKKKCRYQDILSKKERKVKKKKKKKKFLAWRHVSLLVCRLSICDLATKTLLRFALISV